MRLVFGVLLLSAAACGGDDGGFPVGGSQDGGFVFPDGSGGGGGSDSGGGSGGVDGSVLLVDANQIDGRVCLLTDPRILNQCASTGAGGLTVRLGEAVALTSDDGTFSIPSSGGADLVWRVTGTNIVPSFEVLADYFIPAMPRSTFDAMLSANSVMLVQGEGSFMAFASQNGAGVSGQTATTSPAFYQPFYDSSTQSTWSQTSTGVNGTVWVPGIDVGTVTLSVGGVDVTGPIFDGGITFANVLL